MKSILIIGMGRFGHHLCENLAMLGNDVMVVDQKEEVLEDLLPIVTSAKIGDCTNEAVLRSLGIANFDICFVCIGTNFQSSLEITSLVKELGGRRVISKANRDIHAKFLLRNGADEVIYPDRDIAEKMAVRYSANHVFDYIELTQEYSIYEIPPLDSWVGRSVRDDPQDHPRGRYPQPLPHQRPGHQTRGKSPAHAPGRLCHSGAGASDGNWKKDGY